MKIKITVKGFEPLEAELKRLSAIRFETVVKKNMTEIFNRGKAGGTPVDTGELRMSLSQSGDVVGYSKDYALRRRDAYKTGQKRRTLNRKARQHRGNRADCARLSGTVERSG